MANPLAEMKGYLPRKEATWLAVLLLAACSNREPSMTAPPNVAPTGPLGPFTQLTGGERVEIAPGPRLVTLQASSATWWDGDAPVSATLPNVTVRGAQWAAEAKLLVGLGSLDLATKTWTGDAKLARFAQRGPRGENPVREVAWFADQHAALLLESRDAKGTRTTEVVIVKPDGTERARKSVPQATYVVASADRVLVGGGAATVLDLDAKVVADLATPPRSFGAKERGGNFAIVATNHSVVVVRGSDGSVLGTWATDATDAALIEHGVLAIDIAGNVSVGCLDGTGIREVAKVSSGGPGSAIRQVGDRVVVIGGTADPVRVASFTNPCKP
jgi:hypothetical protein